MPKALANDGHSFATEHFLLTSFFELEFAITGLVARVGKVEENMAGTKFRERAIQMLDLNIVLRANSSHVSRARPCNGVIGQPANESNASLWA